MEALEGRRAHLTHIQFHSYGGDPATRASSLAGAAQLAEYVNAHPNLTVDVGQVLFGETTSMTGDGPLGYYLHKVTGRKWTNADTEMEAGCGIVPITYKEKSFVHALQWAIGLEWYLLVHDPWRIAMSTDHPNGGSFLRVSANRPAADGPDVPHEEIRKRQQARAEAHVAAQGPRPRVHAGARSRSSRAPRRRGCSA